MRFRSPSTILCNDLLQLWKENITYGPITDPWKTPDSITFLVKTDVINYTLFLILEINSQKDKKKRRANFI